MKHIFLLFRQKEETSTGTNYELIGFTYHVSFHEPPDAQWRYFGVGHYH